VGGGVPVTSLLDALPRATVAVDRRGRVVAWNAAATRAYGWEREDAIGRDIGDLVVPVTGEDPGEAALQASESGRRWVGELSVLRPDGEIVRLRAFVHPVHGDDGTRVGAVFGADDITATHLLQRQAEDLTAHLGLALAAGDLGTWRWEMATGLTTWDETMERLFGLGPGEFDGTFDAWVDLLHPDDVEEVLAIVERAVGERGAYRMDHRIVRPDGTVRWVQGRGRVTVAEDGTVTGTVGCAADITDRKEAELRAAELARVATERAERDRLERLRLEFLAGLTRSALTAGDHRRFMDAVTHAAVPTLGDWCSLHFLPGGETVPEVSVAHSDPSRVAWARELSERHPFDPDAPTGVAAVIRTGRPEVHLDIPSELIEEAVQRSAIDDEEARAILAELRLTSVIAVPLRTQHGVIGAMQFVSAESGRRYDENDVALALAAAGRIAEALDTLWSSDRHRHVAATLQHALLPAGLPELDGLDVAVRYWPAGAGDVGGDFYDLFRLDGDRVALVIGDVCGKGPEAAGVTGVARHTIRAGAFHGHDATEVLRWVNDAVRRSDPDRFLTACYATLDATDAGWELEVASGGHPLPLVVGADGSVVTVGRPGSLLGVYDEVTVRPDRVRVREGDTVLLYTDGVTDVPPPYDLDDDRLAALVARAAATTGGAEDVADELGRLLSGDLPMARRQDDIALVVVRIGPSRREGA
jgi:PAS domain S-box-containing protein